LEKIIENWMASLPGRDAVLRALWKERVPAAPVLELDEVIEHPQLRERGTIREVDDPYLGNFSIPGKPPSFSGWTYKTKLKAPLLGEDNFRVLQEFCDLTVEEIEDLYDQNVLVADQRTRR